MTGYHDTIGPVDGPDPLRAAADAAAPPMGGPFGPCPGPGQLRLYMGEPSPGHHGHVGRIMVHAPPDRVIAACRRADERAYAFRPLLTR